MAATSSLRSGLLLLALALLLCHSLPAADALWNKYRIHLTNGLTNRTLDAHCVSETGHDLGRQQIPVQGEFSWKVKTDLFGKKKYHCHMRWARGNKGLIVFKINDDWMKQYCGFDFCRWWFKDDGIYSYNEKHKEYKFRYKWDP